MQLKEYDRAEEYVLRITQTRAQSIDYIRDRIHDPTIAALLIGKAYRAAELDIRFSLDPASVLYGNGQFMPVTAMITVLGNLIENAFDAMRGAPTDVRVKSLLAFEREHADCCSVSMILVRA